MNEEITVFDATFTQDSKVAKEQNKLNQYIV
jgi:hypothetical protein